MFQSLFLLPSAECQQGMLSGQTTSEFGTNNTVTLEENHLTQNEASLASAELK